MKNRFVAVTCTKTIPLTASGACSQVFPVGSHVQARFRGTWPLCCLNDCSCSSFVCTAGTRYTMGFISCI